MYMSGVSLSFKVLSAALSFAGWKCYKNKATDKKQIPNKDELATGEDI